MKIVRHTIYLDDYLWKFLHERAQQEKTTMSQLVRQAVRGKYGCGDVAEPIRKQRSGLRPNSGAPIVNPT